jgi:hypothetical protein
MRFKKMFKKALKNEKFHADSNLLKKFQKMHPQKIISKAN